MNDALPMFVMAVGFVSSGLLNLTQAINVIIGSNIGTTATAWLIAFAPDVKALGLFAVLLGAALYFVPVILPIATSFFPNYAEAVVTNGVTTYPNVAAPMAAIHTLFNLITTVFILPFVKPFARLVVRIIRADVAEKPHLSALSASSHISPVIACDQALLEVAFMKESDLDFLSGVRKVLTGEADQKLEEHIAHREDVLDNVQREVTEFLGKIMVKRVPVEVAERARRLLRLTDELESVSDEAATILKVTRRLRKGGQAFPEMSLNVILDVHDRTASFGEKISSMPTSAFAPIISTSPRRLPAASSKSQRPLSRMARQRTRTAAPACSNHETCSTAEGPAVAVEAPAVVVRIAEADAAARDEREALAEFPVAVKPRFAIVRTRLRARVADEHKEGRHPRGLVVELDLHFLRVGFIVVKDRLVDIRGLGREVAPGEAITEEAFDFIIVSASAIDAGHVVTGLGRKTLRSAGNMGTHYSILGNLMFEVDRGCVVNFGDFGR